MPKSQLEIAIEKATNENNVSEDWALILEIVDIINHTNSEKDAIRIITRRLNDKDPHVASHAINLLNACVNNCSRNFKLELCSRVFIDELRALVTKKCHPVLSEKLAFMIKEWAHESDFKTDPALNLIPWLYSDLKRSGIEFKKDKKEENNKAPSVSMSKTLSNAEAALKEEDDLAKAIQLSLKESNAKQSASSSSSLFGSLASANISDKRTNASSNERRRVKALYDFEAAEDNEITFKAGDILQVIDDSDQNWWKGFNGRGEEGLFPSNFVTSDLSTQVETFDAKNKKVSFNENVNIKLLENNSQQADNGSQQKAVIIDEKKIDDCIDQLQNADPTGEIHPDSKVMLDLEDNCYSMGPLIDQQLQQIDSKHAILEDLNMKILEAFQMYNNLMKESISKTSGYLSQQPISHGGANQPSNNQIGLNQQPFVNNGIGFNMSAFPSTFNNAQISSNYIPYVAAGSSVVSGVSPTSYSNTYNTDANAFMLSNQLNNFSLGASNNVVSSAQQPSVSSTNLQSLPNDSYS